MGRKSESKGGRKITGFIIAGLIIGVIAGLSYTSYRLIREKQVRDKEYKSMVAPYYEVKVFQTPKDVVQAVATVAAEKKEPSTYKIPIIMYHYVEYVKDINDTIRKKLDISPNLFEDELKALHEANYKWYFVRDVPDILSGKVVAAPKSIVLTFDDGYEDFYSVVYPILKKYQAKATIYVINNFVNRKGFLTDSELQELAKSDLVEIGAHTLDHLYLKTVSRAIAEKQIKESKRLLEEKLGIKIMTFAYPYGAFNQETINIVTDAGFTAAVSVIPGSLQSETNLMYLSRIRPGIFLPKTIVSILENYKK